MKNVYKYLLLLFVLILLPRCANQLPPDGGPKDTESPEVIETYPLDGTLNFHDNYFEITFSEYIDKLSLLDAIFISPEVERLEYDWSGTSVEITFDDTLDENTTYTVAIGSNVKDLNNANQMQNAVNFAFSTGDKIDIGSISGKIVNKKPTGIMVFAYPAGQESLNPLFNKAKMITQVGENGKFQLRGLRNNNYNLFAILDENGNRLYNIGEDKFGVASDMIQLSDSNLNVRNVFFRLTIQDTIPPFISGVTMTDKNHLSIEFSELIDSALVNSNNFTIRDSISHSMISPKYFYSGNIKKNEYFLSFSDSLNPEIEYFLIAENISDKSNNVSSFDSFKFVVNDKPDTVAPMIKNIGGNYEQNKIDFLNPKITLNFNDGIAIDDLKHAIMIEKIPWKINRISDARFEVAILDELTPEQTFALKVDYSKIKDAAMNSSDSVQTFSVTTISNRIFTGLSGSIKNQNNIKNLKVVIENTEDENIHYLTEVDSLNQFSFKRILPGKYIAWIFEDKDGDNKYNYGRVSPLEYSEQFFPLADTLNLRARWPVGDVLFNISD